MTPTKDLLEERGRLVREAEALLNVTETESRDLSAEEESKFDRLMSDADKIDAQIRASQRRERVAAAAADLAKPVQHVAMAYAKATESADIRGSEDYQKAFRHYLKSGDGSEMRAMSIATDANGGYTVPETVENRIVEKLRQSSVIRGIARVTQTPDDRKIPIQNAIPTAAIIGEGVQITASDATFTQLSIGAWKYGVRVVASRELLADSGINLEEYVIRTGSEAIARAQDAHFWDGTGSSQPRGVINGAGSAITAVTLPTGNATAIASTNATIDKIVEWVYTLPVQYRMGAAIVTSDEVLMNLRKLKDGNGNYIWVPNPIEQMMASGSPGTILGKPYYISEYVDDMAASKHVAVYGNFNYYEIYDHGPTEIVVDPYTLSDKWQIQMMVVRRTDATRTLDEAFVTLKTSAS